MWLEADDTVELELVAASPEGWIDVWVPAPGFLSVAVYASEPLATTSPLLGQRDPGCDAPQPVTEHLRVLDRAADRLTVWAAEAGTLALRVALEDPAQAARQGARLAVRSRFVEGELAPLPSKGGEDEEVIEIDAGTPPAAAPPPAPPTAPLPTKGGEDEEVIEIDAGTPPMAAPTAPLPTKGGEDEEVIEIDAGTPPAAAPPPAPPTAPPPTKGGEDEEVIEIDAGTLLVAPPVPWDRLCPALLGDDHGDLVPCASPLTAAGGKGETGGGPEPDVDLFRFVLEAADGVTLWQVALTAAADVALHAVLYDALGNRLAADDGDRLRIARVLAPGVYFLRLEGRPWQQGAYGLTLEAAPW